MKRTVKVRYLKNCGQEQIEKSGKRMFFARSVAVKPLIANKLLSLFSLNLL